MTTPNEAPKKRQLPTVYTLLFIIIALMAALTWLLPAGKYNYVTAKTHKPKSEGFFEGVKRFFDDLTS